MNDWKQAIAAAAGEVKISQDVSKAFTKMGEACMQAAEALGNAVRAAADFLTAIAGGVDIAGSLKIVNVKAAIDQAPPRIRHLALHSKKHRTQKKNINRALREYRRRNKK